MKNRNEDNVVFTIFQHFANVFVVILLQGVTRTRYLAPDSGSEPCQGCYKKKPC